jgi:S-DNA-T family DNA segregation ATPase FtsK/SpoIIIE
MSFEHPGVTAPPEPRWLGEQLEEALARNLARLTGALVLCGVAVLALCLVSWSAADPSLTHATDARPMNWLGPIGAILADLMMQLCGLGSVVALFPIAFWGLQLVTRHDVPGWRMKLGVGVISVVLIAAALSSLPHAGTWPLRHGYGGLVGDLTLQGVTRLFALINEDRAGLAAGLVTVSAGLALLVSALGLTNNDLRTLFTPPPSMRPTRTWITRFVPAGRAASRAPAPSLSIDPHAAGLAPTHQGWPAHGYAPYAAQEPVHVQAPAANHAPAPSAQYHPNAPQYPSAPMAAHAQAAARPAPRHAMAMPHSQQAQPADHVRSQEFETETDQASREMAWRFAPASSRVATPEPEPAQPKSGFLAGIAGTFARAQLAYKRPPLTLLRRASAARAPVDPGSAAHRGIARLLTDVLADFGVKGEIKDIRPGPVVTLYELEPARGTKTARVIGLADDIARSMSATAVRIAVVPGRNAIGIELPNAKRETVMLRDLVESQVFRDVDAKLPVALGRTIGGEPVVADLARMPHLLVAGTTGSGKSVGVNAMILSLLFRLTPEECRMIMIDPKMLELSVYNGIPHLLTPVVTDPHKAVAALNWIVGEMEERYKRMARLNVRNIEVFNNRVRNASKRGEALARTVQTGFDPRTGRATYETETLDSEPMPYIVVVVDEFADLMAVAGKEIEVAVQRLAQMARAAGIHLVMATQRPSVDIITGTIKANFPTRISFRVTSRIDSRTILNETGAEQLLGQGDMLYSAGTGQIVRVHGPFVSDEEVEAVAVHLRQQGEPRYVAGITDVPAEAAEAPRSGADAEDDLYDQAVAIVLRDRRISTSYLQRRLSIGYNRAADIVERMERDGIVSGAGPTGKRTILVGADVAETPPV